MARDRRGYSPVERRELWARWVRGESVSDIARALDRAPRTIHCTLKEWGGTAPATRRRRASSLTVAEREEISRGIAAGTSLRQIAATLRRAPSTVRDALLEHRMTSPIGDSDAFVFGLGDRVFSASVVRRPAARAWRAAGLEPVPLHSARHTFASVLIAAGLDLKSITTYLGHSTVATSLDIYGHLMRGSEADAIARVDAYLARSATTDAPVMRRCDPFPPCGAPSGSCGFRVVLVPSLGLVPSTFDGRWFPVGEPRRE